MANSERKYSWLERKYLNFYIKRLASVPPSSDSDLYIINPEENREIRYHTRKYIILAAVIAMIGVSLYYFPQYIFPNAFKSIVWTFTLLGFHISIEIISFVYGIILSYIEVFILVILNIHALNKITLICGFPRKGDPDFEDQVFDLITLGMEKNDQRIKKYRINPYQGTSVFTLFLFWIFVNVKQSLSNKAAKFIVRVILGRYVIRQVVDMIGMPVYACWNAYGIIKVIRNARLRIVAPRYIEQFCQYIYERNADNEAYRGFLLHTLQYVSIAKHNYHFAHFLMAKKMLDKFGLTISMEPLDTNHYHEQYKGMDEKTRKDVLNTLILGMIIDGEFSKREQKLLHHLDPDLVKPETIKEIKIQAMNIRKNSQIKYIF